MQRLLEELFRRYYSDVYRYLYSLCRDASLTEELAAEVFLEVVKSIALFREEADLKTWLFSIARHRWYRYLRKNRGMQMEELPENVTEGRLLEEEYCDKEAANRIMELLDREPERTRQVVLLRVEGDSFCEIGKKLGISENSARVIHFRTRNKIREILKKGGFLDEEVEL